MTRFTVVVREPGSTQLDYSLEFEAPEVPKIGAYLSINRPDKRAPLGEDMIVRHVWWMLHHPDTHSTASTEKAGSLVEIFVECDPALGPYSSEDWRSRLEAARAAGKIVEDFQVERRFR